MNDAQNSAAEEDRRDRDRRKTADRREQAGAGRRVSDRRSASS